MGWLLGAGASSSCTLDAVRHVVRFDPPPTIIMQQELKQALDSVDFWERKVTRRFHKNAKKLATWNLWAAQDKAQHIAESFQQGTVIDCSDRPVDFPLPLWKGENTLEYH